MSFSGTVESDFIKFSKIPENRKPTFVNFAATDFESLKAGLVEYIKAVYPQDFNNFYSSELGMMLVELVSYMGAVISFKTDALANECFIRTVKTRTYIESGAGEITNTSTAGKVVEQVVTPNPNDADPDDTFTYNETTNFFEQPTVTYSDDKSSDPK